MSTKRGKGPGYDGKVNKANDAAEGHPKHHKGGGTHSGAGSDSAMPAHTPAENGVGVETHTRPPHSVTHAHPVKSDHEK